MVVIDSVFKKLHAHKKKYYILLFCRSLTIFTYCAMFAESMEGNVSMFNI